MYNLHNESNRRTAIEAVMATGDAACTDIISLVQDSAINVSRASALMLAPGFWTDPETGNRTLTTIASLVFSWDQARAPRTTAPSRAARELAAATSAQVAGSTF